MKNDRNKTEKIKNNAIRGFDFGFAVIDGPLESCMAYMLNIQLHVCDMKII